MIKDELETFSVTIEAALNGYVITNSFRYCPIIKHTIQNIKFGCMSWKSKEVKNG